MRHLIAHVTVLACLCSGAPVHAQFRNPPVPIAGSNLQTLLDAQGQTIQTATQQSAAQAFAGLNVGLPGFLVFGVHNVRGPEWTLSLCDANVPGAPLHAVYPGAALPGWFSMVSFRSSPDRIVLNLFDGAGSLQGTSSYPGIDLFAQTFAIDTGAGTVFSFDARNVGQQPRMLLYHGTGAFAGDAWLCAELDGDQDFDDAVYRLQFLAPTPTRRDSWARVKQLYR